MNFSFPSDSYSKTFVEFTAFDKWICFVWIEWPQQVSRILPQQNTFELRQHSYIQQPEHTHRIAENDNAITLDFTSLTLYKNPWDLACVWKKSWSVSQESQLRETTSATKSATKACSSVVLKRGFKTYQQPWRGSVFAKSGWSKGWGSNVFFLQRSFFFVPLKKMMVSLFVKSRLNECNPKISRLSRWMSATNLVNIWYMIAVVCHLISKNVRTFHTQLWYCVRLFASLWASISMNQFIKQKQTHPQQFLTQTSLRKRHTAISPQMQKITTIGGGFKYFIFSPLLGEDSHVDYPPWN